MTLLEQIIETYPDEQFLKADGLDDAIIGVDEKSMVLIYSVSKCIDILAEKIGSVEEAIEYFSFNVSGAYMGEKTPIWCQDLY
jgi:hypothetical protein